MIIEAVNWDESANVRWIIYCDTIGRSISFCLMTYVYWIICIGKDEAKLREKVATSQALKRPKSHHFKTRKEEETFEDPLKAHSHHSINIKSSS